MDKFLWVLKDYHFIAPNADVETRNIIDKLANFVARNGPEFEQMTQEKQRDNPKFFFLFGGEFNAYYRWKVASEQTGSYVDHLHTTNILIWKYTDWKT